MRLFNKKNIAIEEIGYDVATNTHTLYGYEVTDKGIKDWVYDLPSGAREDYTLKKYGNKEESKERTLAYFMDYPFEIKEALEYLTMVKKE